MPTTATFDEPELAPLDLGRGRAAARGRRGPDRDHDASTAPRGTPSTTTTIPDGLSVDRHRRRQALARADARGAVGQLLPARLEDVRHAHADGPLVRLPARLPAISAGSTSTRELRDWYRDITVANEELLLLFDEMAAVGGTPEDFGLRVRKSPDGLLVTARAKMRNGKEMKLSFDNRIIETIAFHRDATSRRGTSNLTERFLERRPSRRATRAGASAAERSSGSGVGRGRRGSPVRLHDPRGGAQGERCAPGAVHPVVRRERRADRLDGRADLCGRTATPRRRSPGTSVGLIKRTRVSRKGRTTTTVYRIRRIGSPQDEAIDLTTRPSEGAREDPQDVAEQPAARQTRRGAATCRTARRSGASARASAASCCSTRSIRGRVRARRLASASTRTSRPIMGFA